MTPFLIYAGIGLVVASIVGIVLMMEGEIKKGGVEDFLDFFLISLAAMIFWPIAFVGLILYALYHLMFAIAARIK